MRVGDGLLGALGLGRGGADGWRRARPSCSATAAIRASDSCSRSSAASTALGGLARASPVRRRGRTGPARRARVASATRSRASSTAAWTSSRLGAAVLPPRTQPGAEDVAVGGHRGDALAACRRGPRPASGSATRATRSSSCSTAGRTASGALDDVAGPDGRRRRGRASCAGSPAARSARRAGRRGRRRRRAGRSRARAACVDGLDGDRVGGPAQGGGDGALVARRRPGAARPPSRGCRVGESAGGEQGAGAVLAAQARARGPPCGRPALVRSRSAARSSSRSRSTSASSCVERGGGRLVARRRGPPRPPRPRRRAASRRGELAARRSAARAERLLDDPAEPADLGLAGLDPAATGADLAGSLARPSRRSAAARASAARRCCSSA